MLSTQIPRNSYNKTRLKKPVLFRELVPEIPSTTYGTFGLYKYPAKFIPQVIAYALKTYADKDMSVFDPFAGYGTVGTVAKLYGNNYELWDLNPLLKHLHSVAVMRPVKVDSIKLLRELRLYKKLFEPDWSNIDYWYPEQFLPMIQRAWGFYHSLEDKKLKKLLLIPLIKTTRYFSYNDEKRQKLSRSPMSQKRINKLLCKNWREVFYNHILNGLNKIVTKLEEYKSLNPKPVRGIVKSGVNGLKTNLVNKHDILITSPPYLQAQEYIRASKMDLFWLGYSEDEIRKLGKNEFPYQEVPSIPIHSDTYNECLKRITEPHMIQMYTRYFSGVLGTLTRLQESIKHKMLLFLGSATVRTQPIPIDKIFIEHLQHYGWNHEITLVDTIVARAMFFYDANPATGNGDNRMATESLAVLTRS